MEEKIFYMINEIRSESTNNYIYPQGIINSTFNLPIYTEEKKESRIITRMELKNKELIFELDEETKITDIISQESLIHHKGILIHETAYQLMEKYFPKHEFQIIDSKVIHKKKTMKYKWCHSQYDYVNELNYNEMTFFVKDDFLEEERKVKINNKKELIDLQFELDASEYLDFDGCMVLNYNLSDHDIFLFSLNSSNYFVSEKMEKELRSAKLTGLAISEKPISFMYPKK